MEDKTGTIVQYILADSQQEDLKAYLERGRTFEQVDEAELEERYTVEMEKWASSPPPWVTPITLSDLTSEYILRQKDTPSNTRVERSLDVIVGFIKQRMAAGTLEETTTHITDKIEQFLTQKRN